MTNNQGRHTMKRVLLGTLASAALAFPGAAAAQDTGAPEQNTITVTSHISIEIMAPPLHRKHHRHHRGVAR